VLYIAKAIQVFVNDGEFLIKIPYILSKFDMYYQFISSIEIQLFILNLTK
jgi:hypothetical protein